MTYFITSVILNFSFSLSFDEDIYLEFIRIFAILSLIVSVVLWAPDWIELVKLSSPHVVLMLLTLLWILVIGRDWKVLGFALTLYLFSFKRFFFALGFFWKLIFRCSCFISHFVNHIKSIFCCDLKLLVLNGNVAYVASSLSWTL